MRFCEGYSAGFVTAPNPPIATITLPYGEAAIVRAAAIIGNGGCVAVPTETVYGLAADATDSRAVAGIYAAKGRPSFNPLIVHVPDLDAARTLVAFDDHGARLAEEFWPGPMTLVLPLRTPSPIASLVTAGLSTVAIRVPSHPAMQALLARCGRPLAAPSANASGTISPTRADHVLRTLNGRVPLVIDGGATARGIESTIIACIDGTVRLLRPGPLARDTVADLLGIAVGGAGAGIEAPGQLASHYAPSKRLRLNAAHADEDEWWIGFGGHGGDATLSATGDLEEAAARLFDRLHEADIAPRARIAVAPVPDTGLGAAINDRLRRAAV